MQTHSAPKTQPRTYKPPTISPRPQARYLPRICRYPLVRVDEAGECGEVCREVFGGAGREDDAGDDGRGVEVGHRFDRSVRSFGREGVPDEGVNPFDRLDGFGNGDGCAPRAK